jgi:GSH-dependent disulfide-bond oxidoreductase
MITLYTSATGNGYRVSIMLEEVRLPYQAKGINFGSGAHRTPEFMALNPLGKIPVIVDEDADGGPLVLAESLAICLYLAEKTGKLLPGSLRERALAWEWGSSIVSNFGGAFAGIFFARQGAAPDETLIAKYNEDIERYFQAMEAALQTRPYLAGADYSYADVLAAPMVLGTGPAFGVQIERFPAIVRWREAVKARPAVAKGMTVTGL